MNDEEITAIVARLEEAVPRQGAVIKLEQYGGGPDESRIIANRVGYLRFGIEFLKAAVAPPSDKTNKNPFSIEVDLDYLIEDSEIGFDWFERKETFESVSEYNSTFWDKATSLGCAIGCAIGCICLFALAFIGFITVLKSLF